MPLSLKIGDKLEIRISDCVSAFKYRHFFIFIHVKNKIFLSSMIIYANNCNCHVVKDEIFKKVSQGLI